MKLNSQEIELLAYMLDNVGRVKTPNFPQDADISKLNEAWHQLGHKVAIWRHDNDWQD